MSHIKVDRFEIEKEVAEKELKRLENKMQLLNYQIKLLEILRMSFRKPLINILILCSGYAALAVYIIFKG